MLSLWLSREDSTTERLPFLRTEATEEWSEFGTIRQIMSSVHGTDPQGGSCKRHRKSEHCECIPDMGLEVIIYNEEVGVLL